ncbi:MAG: hypothetical protein IPH08_00540 [Rhodocyclaceae bacterium]|nr:hypothetical protein [Rhodocyclaceae bacterium]MBK6905657.1 hypothetical protein [Rhodocyclaceae bacterium]
MSVLIVRFLAILLAVTIAANLLFWAFTGNEKYLQWAKRLGKFSLLALLLIVVLLMAERLLIAL